jgi:hypothetical protein
VRISFWKHQLERVIGFNIAETSSEIHDSGWVVALGTSLSSERSLTPLILLHQFIDSEGPDSKRENGDRVSLFRQGDEHENDK